MALLPTGLDATATGVDDVWMPSYESNQRSKSNNRSL
jgi:hypothetical protein